MAGRQTRRPQRLARCSDAGVERPRWLRFENGQFSPTTQQAPAKELYRYASQLRSLSGGRGLHTEDFSHYEELPFELEHQVIEAAKKARLNH